MRVDMPLTIGFFGIRQTELPGSGGSDVHIYFLIGKGIKRRFSGISEGVDGVNERNAYLRVLDSGDTVRRGKIFITTSAGVDPACQRRERRT